MAGLKEIRSKVASIKSTQKITKAMQLVAASKMRKAQERMAAGRPYADKMRRVIAHLVQANPEYRHPYMIERPVKRVGYIVVSSDRGLCGGLNINLFKRVVQSVKSFREQGVEAEFCLIGQKSTSFLTDTSMVSAENARSAAFQNSCAPSHTTLTCSSGRCASVALQSSRSASQSSSIDSSGIRA